MHRMITKRRFGKSSSDTRMAHIGESRRSCRNLRRR